MVKLSEAQLRLVRPSEDFPKLLKPSRDFLKLVKSTKDFPRLVKPSTASLRLVRPRRPKLRLVGPCEAKRRIVRRVQSRSLGLAARKLAAGFQFARISFSTVTLYTRSDRFDRQLKKCAVTVINLNLRFKQ